MTISKLNPVFDEEQSSKNFPFFDDSLLSNKTNEVIQVLLLLPQKWAAKSADGSTGSAYFEGTD
jgi:hypothetical protein